MYQTKLVEVIKDLTTIPSDASQEAKLAFVIMTLQPLFPDVSIVRQGTNVLITSSTVI